MELQIRPVAQNGPRVLVVGGHVRDSQFVRNAETAGCTVEWVNGDPSSVFPRFCDAVIIAKYQLSHGKFWTVKEAYKAKPMFIADASWSTIKERFETYVGDWIIKNGKQKQTTLGVAMQKAVETKETKPNGQWDKGQAKNPLSNMYVRYSPEQKAKIRETVKAHHAVSMKLDDSAAQMNKLGFTLANGNPIKSCHISVWRNVFGLDGMRRKKVKEAKKAAKLAKLAAEAAIPQAHPLAHFNAKSPTATTKSSTKLVYELILSANLPPVETTALMRKCMDGKLSQDEALKFIELYESLRG